MGKGNCGLQYRTQSAAPHMAKVYTISNQERDLPEAQMAVGYPSINILRNNRASLSSCLSDSTSSDSLQMFPWLKQLPPLHVL